MMTSTIYHEFSTFFSSPSCLTKLFSFHFMTVLRFTLFHNFNASTKIHFSSILQILWGYINAIKFLLRLYIKINLHSLTVYFLRKHYENVQAEEVVCEQTCRLVLSMFVFANDIYPLASSKCPVLICVQNLYMLYICSNLCAAQHNTDHILSISI